MQVAQVSNSLKPPATASVMRRMRRDIDMALGQLLQPPDDIAHDLRWASMSQKVHEYALRPAKRVRPTLLLAGHGLVRGQFAPPAKLVRFAAALELLHTFLLIHDDVADRALLRRGGPSLHLALGGGKLGDDLAVVVGNHLFARSIEAMLESGLVRAPAAVGYLLAICRQTAAGQALDLALTQAPLPEVRLTQVLKVANLKTARFGFVAPLVCGAILAGADAGTISTLERVGRHTGIAFQLVDDLLGLFGNDHEIGKAGGADFFEAKRTFPLIAAWTRADNAGRSRLEALWGSKDKDDASLAAARAEVVLHGGLAATERILSRIHRLGSRSIAALPEGGGGRELIAGYLTSLSRRTC